MSLVHNKVALLKMRYSQHGTMSRMQKFEPDIYKTLIKK